MERNLIEDVARIIVDTELIKPAIAQKMCDLKAHDYGTYMHSLNVSYISVEAGLSLGLDEKDVSDIALGGLLHDIGKLYIPKAILTKRGYLSHEEFEVIKRHPGYGIMECKDLGISEGARDIIYCHHERVDGSGYPEGIKLENMPIIIRIVSVVDAYEAMTSKRPYKEAYTSSASINLLMVDDAYPPTILKILEKISAK